jgi:hypothetical protein
LIDLTVAAAGHDPRTEREDAMLRTPSLSARSPALPGCRALWLNSRLLVVAAGVATLSACGGVQIKPAAVLPKPLVVTMPAHVGLVIPGEMRNFVHNETRWGVEWTVALGEGHKNLMLEVLKDEFSDVKEYKDVESARGEPDLKVIFEPRIEQYSFVTARETGGRYYAVTIRYRIDLYSPAGEKVDSFTLTGYGNALAKGMSSGKPLAAASVAAMRDAAAKFLVQFPEQSIGERLARNEPVILETKSASADAGGIETVPIEEATVDAGSVAAPAPPGPTPAPPTPATTPVAQKAS